MSRAGCPNSNAVHMACCMSLMLFTSEHSTCGSRRKHHIFGLNWSSANALHDTADCTEHQHAADSQYIQSECVSHKQRLPLQPWQLPLQPWQLLCRNLTCVSGTAGAIAALTPSPSGAAAALCWPNRGHASSQPPCFSQCGATQQTGGRGCASHIAAGLLGSDSAGSCGSQSATCTLSCSSSQDGHHCSGALQ